MNDKERILMCLVMRLRTGSLLGRNNKTGWTSDDFADGNGGYYVHFAPWKEPEVGDLVVAESTREPNDFCIGFVHRYVGHAHYIIREIGSDRLCNYSNEAFTPVVGMDKSDLLEGGEYIFVEKVKKAFARKREYRYRYGGVEFPGNGNAVIWVREVFGGAPRESVPFSVKMKFNSKTTVKSILNNMIGCGYGTREFEYRNAEEK